MVLLRDFFCVTQKNAFGMQRVCPDKSGTVSKDWCEEVLIISKILEFENVK